MPDHCVPVLVGVGQVNQRDADPAAGVGREPLALMIDAVRAAAADADSSRLLGEVDSVRVIRGMWPYRNPAKAVAEAIGSPNAETGISTWGGNSVQSVLSTSALEIQRGERNLVVLAGAECGRTQAKARRAGIELGWREAPGTPDRHFGQELKMRHRTEAERGIAQPIHMYPIFESAIRHARGETPGTHMARVSELWAGFANVAAGNPQAWMREAKTAREIRTPSAANRPVAHPYPKLMNANNHVDQAAALILCSTATAKRFGVPESKWVYPWAATEANDTLAVSNRDNLHRSPAIRIAGGRCLELADIDAAGVAHVDVYSCFPSAVQVSAAELGLGGLEGSNGQRPLTVTGGMTFGGGPLNNYVSHGIARMVEVLREHPDELGLVTSNGGFITKHAFGVYSTAPPPRGFRHASPQAEVDATPRREAAPEFAGPVRVEGYTAVYGAEGPRLGLAACLLEDGRRTWGNTRDPEVCAAMTREDFCARPAALDAAGQLAF